MQLTVNHPPKITGTCPTQAQAIIAVGRFLKVFNGIPDATIEEVQVTYGWQNVPFSDRVLVTRYHLKVKNTIFMVGSHFDLDVEITGTHFRSYRKGTKPGEWRTLVGSQGAVDFDTDPEQNHAERILLSVCELWHHMLQEGSGNADIQRQLAFIGDPNRTV